MVPPLPAPVPPPPPPPPPLAALLQAPAEALTELEEDEAQEAEDEEDDDEVDSRVAAGGGLIKAAWSAPGAGLHARRSGAGGGRGGGGGGPPSVLIWEPGARPGPGGGPRSGIGGGGAGAGSLHRPGECPTAPAALQPGPLRASASASPSLSSSGAWGGGGGGGSEATPRASLSRASGRLLAQPSPKPPRRRCPGPDSCALEPRPQPGPRGLVRRLLSGVLLSLSLGLPPWRALPAAASLPPSLAPSLHPTRPCPLLAPRRRPRGGRTGLASLLPLRTWRPAPALIASRTLRGPARTTNSSRAFSPFPDCPLQSQGYRASGISAGRRTPNLGKTLLLLTSAIYSLSLSAARFLFQKCPQPRDPGVDTPCPSSTPRRALWGLSLAGGWGTVPWKSFLSHGSPVPELTPSVNFI